MFTIVNVVESSCSMVELLGQFKRLSAHYIQDVSVCGMIRNIVRLLSCKGCFVNLRALEHLLQYTVDHNDDNYTTHP